MSDCAVCLEALGVNNITRLVCNHAFHASCFISWSRQGANRDSCPLCRRDVVNVDTSVSSEEQAVLTGASSNCVVVPRIEAPLYMMDNNGKFVLADPVILDSFNDAQYVTTIVKGNEIYIDEDGLHLLQNKESIQ